MTDRTYFLIELRVILFSAGVGLLIGVLSALVDYIVFYQGSFLEILITDVPLEELAKRALALLVCLFFGILLAQMVVDRLRAEHAQSEIARQFRLLFEQAPDAIFISDDQGRIVNCNAAAEELTGYDRLEFIGRYFTDVGLFPPDQRDRLRESLALQRSGDGLGPMELTLTGKDGRKRVTEIRQYPVDVRGRTLVTVFVRDITERRRAESERAMLEDQLRQAQKMESIGRLAGGIAHDFNNLLTSIIGHAELGMMQQKARGVQTAELEEIISSGHRAAQLTRQLLTFSRKQVLAPVVLNLNETINRLLRTLHRLIGEDVRVVNRLDPNLGNVRADPVQIEQMLMNLAINARDAMPRGGQLTIETANVVLDEEYARTHAQVTPGPHAMLSVADTGHGMSREVQSHVFEPFFTTKEVGKGTGLGLSMVYGIVKQHDGSIWLSSEEGRGTTFRIYLPVVDAPAETPPTPTEAPVARRGRETVLLVEDQESVRSLVQKVLTEHGYRVLTADNGREALRIARQQPVIHLLLTDVIMPEMNGQEVHERLAPSFPDMRVIYMSGYTDDVVMHRGLIHAGTTFLQKPISVYELTRAVREVLERKDRS